MKLENNNIKISISRKTMEVVENVFTLTVRVLTQTAEFFCMEFYSKRLLFEAFLMSCVFLAVLSL